MAGVTSFAIVGSGWRAEYFWRLANGLTCLGVVSRSPKTLPVPVFLSLDECLAARPDFVVTAVPWGVTPSLVVELVARGVPVLAETPPAPDLDGLRALWHQVGDSGLVQVAEQYSRMPAHAARIALVRAGVIGDPTRVDVSSTHQYHAVSLIRTLLSTGPRTCPSKSPVISAQSPQVASCNVQIPPSPAAIRCSRRRGPSVVWQ